VNQALADILHDLALDRNERPATSGGWRRLLDRVSSALDARCEEAKWREKADRTEHHYSHLFEESPIPSWEENFTAVGAWLDQLERAGVADLSGYFEANPHELLHGASLIEVTNANTAALTMLGVNSRGDVLGRFDVESFNEDSRHSYQAQFLAIWDDVSRIAYEITGQRANGERVDAILHWSAPRVGGALDLKKVVVQMVDITERKEAMERMQALIRSKDDFLATVSHELRTPLTSVYGSSETLLDQWSLLDSTVKLELVQFIAQESGELADLVEDLLVAARAEIGLVSIAPRLVELRPLVMGAVEAATRSSTAKHIDASRVDQTAWADPLRLKQVVRNLLTNAIRYGGDHIVVEAEQAGSQVALTVLDDGSGVPIHHRESIFELYQRAHSRAGNVASVGVGLAVSRQLTELMGGELTYDYAAGWSRFRIEIPAFRPSTLQAEEMAAGR
jgi:signal transduction histidine kinase